jgi:tetratricopeptide (TPR) repeat protein
VFWYLGGCIAEGCDRLLAVESRDPALVPAIARASIMTGIGTLTYFQGDMARAIAASEEGLALARSVGHAWMQTIALVILGIIDFSQSDLPNGRRHLEEAASLAQTVADPWLESIAIAGLGLVALYGGDLAKATDLCSRAVSLARSTGEKWGIFNALYHAGIVAIARGDAKAVRQAFTEAMQAAQRLNHRYSQATALSGLAWAILREGGPEHAAAMLGAADLHQKVFSPHSPPAFARAHTEIIDAVRSALSEETFAAAWTQGRSMSLEQAIHSATQPPSST